MGWTKLAFAAKDEKSTAAPISIFHFEFHYKKEGVRIILTGLFVN